jgi:hypothetical protein
VFVYVCIAVGLAQCTLPIDVLASHWDFHDALCLESASQFNLHNALCLVPECITVGLEQCIFLSSRCAGITVGLAQCTFLSGRVNLSLSCIMHFS